MVNGFVLTIVISPSILFIAAERVSLAASFFGDVPSTKSRYRYAIDYVFSMAFISFSIHSLLARPFFVLPRFQDSITATEMKLSVDALNSSILSWFHRFYKGEDVEASRYHAVLDFTLVCQSTCLPTSWLTEHAIKTVTHTLLAAEWVAAKRRTFAAAQLSERMKCEKSMGGMELWWNF
jgi:hypothetical protein